jgi:DNA-binding MarR family transcriptional regulator
MGYREDELDDWKHLSHALVTAAEETKTAFADAVQPFGLSAPAARALLAIVSPTPMRVLAELLTCDPSYLTGIADQLETAGLVVRAVGADRRVKLLELTETGEQTRNWIVDAVATADRFSTRLTSADRTQLARLLQKLLDSDTST